MAYSVLRFRKLCYVEPVVSDNNSSDLNTKWTKTKSETNSCFSSERDDIGGVGIQYERAHEDDDHEDKRRNNKKKKNQRNQRRREWRCVDTCCWVIGCVCTAWWALVFLSQFTALMPAAREAPGARLRREEGLIGAHPVILVPGIVTGGLELWEGRPCSDGLFRKRLWGGSFTEIFKRYN